MKKALALVVMALLLGWGVAGTVSAASATDPTTALERRVARLEKQVQSLQHMRGCLDPKKFTRYSNYATPDGGTTTGLDFTRSPFDYVGGSIVLWSCASAP